MDEHISAHFPPHLHKSIEMIYVTSGELTVGTGVDLFEMHEGDFAIIFPNLIHHYQVFRKGDNRHEVLLASPTYFGVYEDILQSSRPKNPVIPGKNLHPDILYALDGLAKMNMRRHKSLQKSQDPDFFKRQHFLKKTEHSVNKKDEMEEKKTYALNHAYVQIILARALSVLALSPRADLKDQDIVYQVVAYVASHYQENISLTQMGADLGISPFALSRVFSGVFHQNFNRYVNEVRLEHVCVLLAESAKSITEISFDCGFQSQATFNRVFQTKYHMTPREYRNAKNAADNA